MCLFTWYIFSHYFVSPLFSFCDSSYVYVRLLNITPELSEALVQFLTFFSLLLQFGYFPFSDLLFFCSVSSAVNHIHYIFYLMYYFSLLEVSINSFLCSCLLIIFSFSFKYLNKLMIFIMTVLKSLLIPACHCWACLYWWSLPPFTPICHGSHYLVLLAL